MLSQNWVTLLSLLVSGTMIFTLGATVFLYAKYKIGQQPALQMHQTQSAMAGAGSLSPSLTLEAAIQMLNDSKAQSAQAPQKKKIRFSNTASGS
jgi:hypothetical protein